MRKYTHSFIFFSLLGFTSHANALVEVFTPGLNLLAQTKFIQPLPSEQKLSFTLRLKFRNKDKMDKLVQEIYDPNSPNYQKFLSFEDYQRDYAPSKKVEDKIQHYFALFGMSSKVINHSIRVFGTAQQVEKALNTPINFYQYKNQIFFSNEQAVKLNKNIAQYVNEIDGLNNIPKYQDLSQELTFTWNNFSTFATPTDISLNGFTGANLQKTYNLQNITPINGAKIDGSGQTLVVVDVCGSNSPAQILKDSNQYFKANNIQPFVIKGSKKNFAIINPDGSPFTRCPSSSSFSNEISLDIQSSHTIAPGNNTVLVLGTDHKSTLIDVINTLIHDNFTIAGFPNAYVISNSWGTPENGNDQALESALEIAAVRGISVNVSSGDCGDYTYTTAKCTPAHAPTPAVNYPGSSAYVTSVGATALFVNNNYRYSFETLWGKVANANESYSFDGGTGGGISLYYGPVSWQSSISNFTAGGYGIISNFGNKRAVPDIAMLGDPQTGLLIISDGVQIQDGGTSLASPLFSGTLVLVNQARKLLNKDTPIGLAAPYLYQQNQHLVAQRALNVIMPPTAIIRGATIPGVASINGIPVPGTAFTVSNKTFGWDSSLTIEPESQFWNDAIGVGSPNIPIFVKEMANM